MSAAPNERLSDSLLITLSITFGAEYRYTPNLVMFKLILILYYLPT